MSVFTPVSRDALAAWLIPLPVGPLEDFQGIAAGVQNSNYFVRAGGCRYVLTLFEHLAPDALAFYLELQACLAGDGFPCPRPLADSQGQLQRPLAGKPAALFTCLPGQPCEHPTPLQCARIGAALGRLHRLADCFAAAPAHSHAAPWRQATARRLREALTAADQALLDQALAADQALPWSDLPRGLIHADLFRDNVLWQGDDLGGILDFYFAGSDALLFDLAVAANDWCQDPSGRLDPERLAALTAAYAAERPLAPEERQAWPAMLAAAALRFWLSRLDDALNPRPGALVTVKDPAHFRQLLAWLLGPGAHLAAAALPG